MWEASVYLAPTWASPCSALQFGAAGQAGGRGERGPSVDQREAPPAGVPARAAGLRVAAVAPASL